MKRILLLFFLITTLTSVGLYAQERTVTGTITSPDGTALPGVNIIVKGTSIGTISDSNGAYSINVPSADSQLTFSFIGYATQTVAVGTNTTLSVQLVEDVATLQEVVVSGLATSVKRENLANAVSTLSAKDLMGSTTPITTDGAFQGKVAGANIQSNGSMPGGGFNMQFRGVSTLGNSSSQPLYIIDGVYLDNSQVSNGRSAANKAAGGTTSTQDNNANRLADINPDDIASVEILKGSSAAAIYGTRANAGVVIITTKRGTDGKTKISFGQDIGFSNALSFYGGSDWTDAKIVSYFNPNDVTLLADAKAKGTYKDWEREIFGGTGTISNTHLSITGGDAKTKFYINGSRSNETGIIKNTGFTRNSIRANLDHKITDWLEVGFNSNYIQSNNDRGWAGNDNANINYGYSVPYSKPYINLLPNEFGVYPDNPGVGENPLAIRDRAINNQQVNRLIGGVGFTARAINNERSSLTFKINSGIDYQNGYSLVFLPRDLQSQRLEANPGFAQDTRNEVFKYNLQLSAVYTHTAMDNRLNLTSSAGIVQLGTEIHFAYIRGTGMPLGTTQPARAAVLAPFGENQHIVDQGFFAQQEANFEDKVIATAGVRFDRSTLLGDASKVYAFPKGSVAFNIHKFFDLGTTISQVKLRAAYGETAGLPIWGALYSQLNTSTIASTPGLTPNTIIGNPNIKPESAAEFEYGLDFGLFNNKITAEITMYNKKVSDLILPLTLAPTAGATSTTVNAADLVNTGMEISVGAQVVDKPNFTWFVQPMFWFNRSEITRLSVPEFLTGGFGATYGQWRVKQGFSPTQIVAAPRLDPTDVTGYTVYGDAQPKFTMSLNQRITFLKNFEFNALAEWRSEFTVVSLQRLLWDEGGTTSDWNSSSMLRGTNGQYSDTPAPNGKARQNANGIDANGHGIPGVGPSTASFIKLREVSLYYRIPVATLKGAFGNVVRGARIGVSGNNLFRWTDYAAGYDPENSNFGALALGSGVDLGSTPAIRRVMFHVVIEF